MLTVRWNALTESRVAVLDRRFGAQLGRWPEVNAALIDRVNERAQRLAITQAISQLNRVDRRLLSLFWHLAERWGRDVLHCPYCHGWEVRDRRIGVLAGAMMPTHQAQLFRQLSNDVTLFRQGQPLTDEELRAVEARGIRIVDDKVVGLDVRDDRLAGVVLASLPTAGFAAAESYHIHRPHLHRLAECDPRVSARIQLGKDIPAADYVALRGIREAAMREYEALAAPFDAIAMPTTPCVAPTIAEADASDEAYARWNLRLLRNPAFINFVDGCAVSLPCHEPGAAPVGLMLCGAAMGDRRLLAVAAAVERALSRD